MPCARRAAAPSGRSSTTWSTLETSGLLERLGYEVPKVTYDSLFRYPDRIRRAFAAGNRR